MQLELGWEERHSAPKPKGDVLSIGSLTPLVVSSAPVLSQKAAIAAGEADLRCGDKGSLKTRLEPGANLIQGKLTTIEDLMESLSLAGGRELEKEVEIEVRMLYGSDPNDPDSFQRVRLWLEQLFPEVQPVDFQERRYNVPSERIGSGFIASYVWRGTTDMYIKIKNKKMISLALPSIHNIIPCLGVSVESRSFQFDTSQNPGEQPNEGDGVFLSTASRQWRRVLIMDFRSLSLTKLRQLVVLSISL